MIFELTINEEVYQFKFGMGFVREINKTANIPVSGVPGASQDVGLALAVTKILDEDIVTLVDVLVLANKGFTPRVTRTIIEDYVDADSTDVDEMFNQVMDFLERANATKKVAKKMKAALGMAETENTKPTETE